MPGVSLPGIGSGLDISGLVSQLVAAEAGPPVQRLDRRELRLTTELSALGALQGSLADFQTSQKILADIGAFQKTTVKSGNTNLFSATGTTAAQVGLSTVEVKNLAQSQKLGSKAFSNSTDSIGTGTLNFRFGTYASGTNTFTTNPNKSSQSVTISAGNDSLQAIRDAVNATDFDVTASIVDDGTGKRLVFSSLNTGADNSLEITVSGDGDGNNTDDVALSQFAYDPTAAGVGTGKNLTENVQAEDAVLVVDGINITRPSNTVTGVLEGVTLVLIKEEIGTVASITVTNDDNAVTGAVNEFVNSYNTLKQLINDLGGFDAATEIAGELLGDSTLRSVENQIQRIATSRVDALTGAFRSISEIGISTQFSDGTLVLDSTELQAALAEDRTAVAKLFAEVGDASDSLVNFTGFTDASVAGRYTVSVTQVATQALLTGAATSPFPITVDANNDTLSVRVDGTASLTITLTQGSFATGTALAAELQSRINGDSNLSSVGAIVTVNFVTDHFEITSTNFGSGSEVEILSVDTNTASTLGLSINSGVDGVDVAGTIGGFSATGSGRILTGSGDASGLSVDIIGGIVGDRGTISFARGISAQLDDAVSLILGANSIFDSRINGINGQISDIADDRIVLNRRLAGIESRLLAQFIALDTLLAQLQSTSNFLTQQLAALPGPRIANRN